VGAEVADGPCILALISGFLDCDGRMSSGGCSDQPAGS
jgi:hypothetical protein